MIKRWWNSIPNPGHYLYADIVLLPFWCFLLFLCIFPFLYGALQSFGFTGPTPTFTSMQVYDVSKTALQTTNIVCKG